MHTLEKFEPDGMTFRNTNIISLFDRKNIDLSFDDKKRLLKKSLKKL